MLSVSRASVNAHEIDGCLSYYTFAFGRNLYLFSDTGNGSRFYACILI
jgi:hypothetical protein